MPRREVAYDRGCFDYTQKTSGQKNMTFYPYVGEDCHHLKNKKLLELEKHLSFLVSAFGKNIHSKAETSQFIK